MNNTEERKWPRLRGHLTNRASRSQEVFNVKSGRVPAIDRGILVRNGPKTKSGRGRPQAKADEFPQYAEERRAHQSKTEKDKEALIDLARVDASDARKRKHFRRQRQSAMRPFRSALRTSRRRLLGRQFLASHGISLTRDWSERNQSMKPIHKEARSGEGFAPNKGGRPRFGAPASRSEHFKARRCC